MDACLSKDERPSFRFFRASSRRVEAIEKKVPSDRNEVLSLLFRVESELVEDPLVEFRAGRDFKDCDIFEALCLSCLGLAEADFDLRLSPLRELFQIFWFPSPLL